MNVINAAMAKAAGQPKQQQSSSSSASAATYKHEGGAGSPQRTPQAPPESMFSSFLYGGLSPAAAALLPRLYAANSFLSAPVSSAGTPNSTAAPGLLATTVPAASGARNGADLNAAAAANFMLAAGDPSLWAALSAGGFVGNPFGAGPTPPTSGNHDLLAQTAQLMAAQQQQQQQQQARQTATDQ